MVISLEKWKKALASYGTPEDFADNTSVACIFDAENTNALPVKVLSTPNYLRRKELIKKRVAEIKPENDCFLCEDISQAIKTGDNLLFSQDTFQDYIFCPNRFPYINMHSLLIAKTHDPPGYKVGNSITKKGLEMIIELSSKYQLSISRNHPYAGRSVPDHEHYHVLPKLIKMYDGNYARPHSLCESMLENTEFGKNIFKVKRSHFDTLVFKKDLDVFFLVLKKIEKNNVIFTFLYDANAFYLTPHKNHQKNIGSGDPEYFKVKSTEENFSYKQHISFLKENIYTKETFNWQDYF